jgi:pimeloyl-ACP methyl ester carboxylesterase
MGYRTEDRRTVARNWCWISCIWLLVAAGCLPHCRDSWCAPADLMVWERSSPQFEMAERHLAWAIERSDAQDASCVDHYFAAAICGWPLLWLPEAQDRVRGERLYQVAVAGMLEQAAAYGRFDPQRGIMIQSHAGLQVVPVRYHGFLWHPSDFREFLPVGRYASSGLTRAYREPGLGLSLVVRRRATGAQDFMRPDHLFPATALLRPDSGDAHASPFVLEFYDPLHAIRDAVPSQLPHVAGRPITRDITAPLAYSAITNSRMWLTNYLQPGLTRSSEGLYMLEPYQPGKIPIVFVHGLLSDPLTWIEMGNELRAAPGFLQRYQIWVFQYPTAAPFFESAATLRRQLRQIRDRYDPARADPAFSQMVLIGHSMGGIIAKLQVTHSGETLWRKVARVPVAGIRASDQVKRDLAESFYFAPSSDIQRVILIGTPHQGSSLARRCIGKIGARLARVPEEDRAEHERLVAENPGVFSDEFQRRYPTSVDLLQPNSDLLQATNLMPYRYGVKLHSIIGTGGCMLGSGPSDGVVPVSSARLGGVESELIIEEDHEDLQRTREAIREVLRILALPDAELESEARRLHGE